MLTHAVKLHPEDTAASSTTLGAIKKNQQFWRPIWDRVEPDWTAASPDITDSIGPPHVAEEWPHLTGSQLAQAAKAAKGTAPGLDQWTQAELRLLSPEIWDAVAGFVRH